MNERHPIAPFPEKSFELLQEAIDILDGTEPTKDERVEAQRAIEVLDRLIELMRNFDRASYPTGSPQRIVEARAALNAASLDHRELAGAKEVLKAVLRNWTDFCRDEELEG